MMRWSRGEAPEALFHPRRRLFVVAGLLLCGFVLLVGRAVQLHLSDQPTLAGVANKQYHAKVPVEPQRGKVIDTRGRELATNVPKVSVFADPAEVVDPQGTVDALADTLALSKTRRDIEQRLRSSKRFAWIKRRVSLKTADKVRQLRLPGVHFIEETKRFYPNQELASQIVGAVSRDAQPLSGIELAFDQYLRNAASTEIYERDARGRTFFMPAAPVQEKRGDVQLQLTIDKVIQYQTEQALGKAVEKAKARGGVAVVADPHTGRILAMSSMPTFNPNAYWKFPQDAWRNRAITDTIEPGSTFKMLVLSAALEAGMPPERKFDCEGGAITVGNAVLHDSHSHGVLSLADILKVSSNIGTVKIAQALGKERVAQALHAFGIGQKTGIDFPGEVSGIMRSPVKWQPVDMATIAFGQGVAVTPLQMTMAMATIANSGVLMKPFLVERVTASDGLVVHSQEPFAVRRVMSASTAETMRTLLGQVVEKGGTGTAAATPLYRVAGKTGTAQKVSPGHKGYTAGKYFASFVGMAPLVDPRLVIYVGLDEPVGAYYGGVIAAPVFREIAEAALQYLEVPTDGVPVITADASPEDVADIANVAEAAAAKAAPVPVERTAAPREAAGGVRMFVATAANQYVVPRLTGLSMREVLRLAGDSPVRVKTAGSGIAVAQRPAAGSTVTASDVVEVELQVPHE